MRPGRDPESADTPTARESLDLLLTTAIIDGSDHSYEAFGAIGPAALRHFRDYLSGARQIPLPRVSDPRGQMDNETGLSCWLGGRYPEEYLATFNSTEWLRFADVVTGLGCTRLPAATATLIAVLEGDGDVWVRLSAARSLRHLPGDDTVRALLRALDDGEYLVQYHAIGSLGAVGDRAVLDRLRPLVSSPHRGIALVAAEAVAKLTERFA
jgi:hypothetical protein